MIGVILREDHRQRAQSDLSPLSRLGPHHRWRVRAGSGALERDLRRPAPVRPAGTAARWWSDLDFSVRLLHGLPRFGAAQLLRPGLRADRFRRHLRGPELSPVRRECGAGRRLGAIRPLIDRWRRLARSGDSSRRRAAPGVLERVGLVVLALVPRVLVHPLTHMQTLP